MPDTPYLETEALLMAIEDFEIDSGIYTVDEYLDMRFTEHELRKLAFGAATLADRAWEVLQRKRA